MRAYDRVASDHGRQLSTDLDDKPFDCEFLDRIADNAPRDKPVLDAACGPGQVASYLGRKGLQVVAVDASPAMVRVARQHHPEVDAYSMDLRSLRFADGSFGAVIGRYALLHLPREAAPAVLDELARILAPQAGLLLMTYAGSGDQHAPPLGGQDDSETLPITLYEADEFKALIERHDAFVDVECARREPYAGEQAYPRLFVSATRR